MNPTYDYLRTHTHKSNRKEQFSELYIYIRSQRCTIKNDSTSINIITIKYIKSTQSKNYNKYFANDIPDIFFKSKLKKRGQYNVFSCFTSFSQNNMQISLIFMQLTINYLVSSTEEGELDNQAKMYCLSYFSSLPARSLALVILDSFDSPWK